MSVTYNGLHVDERYSAILEPNLYFNPILVPGVTCTDKYETGPAGQIFVHQLNTSAVEAGTPGRDFTDEVAADTLIPMEIQSIFFLERYLSAVFTDMYRRPLLCLMIK